MRGPSNCFRASSAGMRKRFSSVQKSVDTFGIELCTALTDE